MAIREGAWDCPACGRRRNRGPQRHCAGCGRPRGEGVELYLPDEARVVTAADELERAGAGPDWTCGYCGGDNPAGDDFCTGCGAGRDGSPPRPVVEHRVDEGGVAAAPAAATPVAAAAAMSPAGVADGTPAPPAPPAAKRKVGKKGCGCGLGCAGMLVLALLALFLARPQPSPVTVAGFSWERSVEVERLETVAEEAWEDEVPAAARVLAREPAVRRSERVQVGSEEGTRTVRERVQTGTERVKVGVRDLGNGYFEDVFEQRPVYEWVERQEETAEPVYEEREVEGVRVRYEIERWRPERSERAEGRGRDPAWPVVRLGSGEREGERRELYRVHFTGAEGEALVWETGDESAWRRLEPGQRYRARVGGGEVKEILGPYRVEAGG